MFLKQKPLYCYRGFISWLPVTFHDGLKYASLFAMGYRTNTESFSPHDVSPFVVTSRWNHYKNYTSSEIFVNKKLTQKTGLDQSCYCLGH